jgi:hypothetical protein
MSDAPAPAFDTGAAAERRVAAPQPVRKRLVPEATDLLDGNSLLDNKPVKIITENKSATAQTSQFNTLRAVVAVARRIYDTKLLPPHSRTLNHSLLKRLMESVSLYTNREVKDFYKMYKQTDIITDDLQHLTDRELRDQKKDVREYVDRLLCPQRFLETEIEGGQFTGAFTACIDYAKSIAPNNKYVEELADDNATREKALLEWPFQELARVIVRHADIRGNISDSLENQDSLLDRYNWYSAVQHVWGDLYVEFSEIESQIEAPSRNLDADQALRARILNFGKRISELNPPVVRTLDGKTWKEVQPLSALWEEFKNKSKTLFGWDLHISVAEALKVESVMKTDEPITAFDIAILGGLHPRTYAIEKYARQTRRVDKRWLNESDKSEGYQVELASSHLHRFKVDEFFENCMVYFDSREDRSADLGYVMYRTPLAAVSKHTSFLPFRRVPSEASSATRTRAPPNFGAETGGGAKRKQTGDPQTETVRRADLSEYSDVRRVIGPAVRQKIDSVDDAVDQPRLEQYCDKCFEQGVALYIRLVHVMVKNHLLVLRRRDQSDDQQDRNDFLKAFAKLVGLTVQRASLQNPRILFTNTAATRDMQRANRRGMVEAKASLCAALGVALDVNLEGYTADGGFYGYD